MVQVQEATFTPAGDGGTIQANMKVGQQEITTAWPLDGPNQGLAPLLDRLMVKVEQITFLQTPNGGEIRANLTIGDRAFVSRLPIADDDPDLRPVFDQLMSEIGTTFMQTIEAALRQQGAESYSS